MKLYVDDMRVLPEGDDCICVRSADDAITMLSIYSFEYISLDFDLGYTSLTGLDILKWMAWRKIAAPHINIHSSHPVGAKTMLDFCKSNFKDSTITAHSLY